MEKKNVVFLTVMAVLTLFVASIGTALALLTTTMSPASTTPTVIKSTDNLGVTYSDGETVNTTGEPVGPGWSKSKTISVKNDSEISLEYEIKWIDVSNNFVKGNNGTDDTSDDTDDLVYSITKEIKNSVGTVTTEAKDYLTSSNAVIHQDADDEAAPGKVKGLFVNKMPYESNVDLVSKTSIAPGETHTYVVTFSYLETGIEQNENTDGKVFKGTFSTLAVESAHIKSN